MAGNSPHITMQCVATFSINVCRLVYQIDVSDAIYVIFIYLLVSMRSDAKELIIPKDSPHITMQCATKFSINVCSLSVLAVCVLTQRSLSCLKTVPT